MARNENINYTTVFKTQCFCFSNIAKHITTSPLALLVLF